MVSENDLGRAKIVGARNADGFAIVRLVAATVGDHQLAAGFPRGIDHLLALGRSASHGFLGEDMLAGLQSTDGVFGMHAIWKDDVNNIDFGVFLDGVIVLVVVNASWIYAVTHGQLVGFVRMAAYKRHDLRFLAFGESGQNLVDREAAQSNNSPSKFLARGIGDDKLLCIGIPQ